VSVLPALDDKPRAVQSMFDGIAGRYDLLNRLLTLGMDVGWRRETVDALGLRPGARVLDLACGTGDLCRELGAGGIDAIGLDFSIGMLEAASTHAPLVHGDALALPFPDVAFDGVTCGFALRNFATLRPVLAECARVVRSGGRIALLEVAAPASRPARAVHSLWFRSVVPFVGGLLSDRTAYRYLPASTAYLPSLPDLLAMLDGVGIVDVEHRLLGFGAAQLITGTRA
jgi:demethylmenaquinone methyltransferase/2-methoxy-6-polyprenyl-1,4-benzoquinol methylase